MFAIPPPSIARIQTVPIKCGKGGVIVEPHKFVSCHKFLVIEFRSTSIYTLDIEKEGKKSWLKVYGFDIDIEILIS